MPAEYPFQMIGRVPVVTAPAEIDITTAGQLRAILSEWHNRGNTTVVVDLTQTMYCDMAALHELERAHERAVAVGGGLRLVTRSDGAVARIFTLSGVDGAIPHFATVELALARLPATAVWPRRRCEQCGAAFVPIREHARFCTSDCRAAWNRAHLGQCAVDGTALTWSIAAMSEATARLPAAKVWDQPRAVAAIADAVWWITMVDATLVRHHQRTYDTAIAAHTPAERQLINETLAGLRFVRNWMSRAWLGEVIESGVGSTRITGWTWKPVPEPPLAWLPSSAQAWELARYRAYQARLAGRAIGKTFCQAVTFLTLTGASATSG